MNDDFGTFSYGNEKKEDSGRRTADAEKKSWSPQPYKESIYGAPNYTRTDYSRQTYLKPSESRYEGSGSGNGAGSYAGTGTGNNPNPFVAGVQQSAGTHYGTSETQVQQNTGTHYGASGTQAQQSTGTHYGAQQTPVQRNRETEYTEHGTLSERREAAPSSGGSGPTKPGKNGKKESWGRKVLLTALLGLVFGVIAGGAFIGLNKVFGDSEKSSETGVSAKNDPSDDKETGSTQTTLTTGDQIKTQDVISDDDSSQTINYDVAEIVKKAQPSIVSITTRVTTQYQYFYQQFEQESTGAGSGIIIGESPEKLYIATNYHVIQSAKEINVGFNDGQILKAKVTGYDKTNDVAVVEIPIADIPESTAAAISVAVPGNSDELQVGEPAIAIGNALGYGQSVTVGYISALNRSISGNEGSYIQTDAAINPGNSGGALINAKGEVIGINSVKYVDSKVEGMGFSIPINRALTIIDGLINGGTSGKVYIGISGANISAEYSQIYGFPEGAYVKSVTKDSPAERAGIHEGDIIVGLEGMTITTMEQFVDQLQNYKAGTEVRIDVYRANSVGKYEKQTVTAVTAEE